MTKVFLLRHGPYLSCPFRGKDKGNLDKARTFKSAAAARSTNEFRHDGYEVIEAFVTIQLA